MKVQVKDLRKGDELASGAVIDRHPASGLRTPSGKLEIYAKYPNQPVPRLFYWHKNTTVTVTNR